MLAKIVSTWFGVGLSPMAPGTVGSIAALPFAWGLLWWGGWMALAAAALICTFLGIWASQVIAEADGIKDPGYVVVDEVAGQWIALIPAPLDPVAFLIGLVLFRLFDIVKPGPIGWLDRKLSGGVGIMMDDVLAGVISAALLYLIYEFNYVF